MILLLLTFLFQLGYADTWKTNHLISGCTIFDSNGIELKKFPGFSCVFFPDGHLASVQEDSIQYLSPESKVVWELKGYFHHQLNLNLDGKKLLALSIEETEFKNQKVKVDLPMIIDLKGKVVASVSMKKFLKQPHLRTPDFRVNKQFGLSQEMSHINSFYEVARADQNQPVQYVLNGLEDGIFLLSEDLQKLHLQFKLPAAKEHRVHDVQIVEPGKLIAFVNFSARSEVNIESSEIIELDYIKDEVIFRFPQSPDPFFFSAVAGSVQKISDGTYLFTTVNSGSFIFSQPEKKIVRSFIETHMVGGALMPVQQVKSQNLTSFLKHWK